MTYSWNVNRLRKEAPHAICFNFFDVPVCVRVPSMEDLEQLRFFYGYCETPSPNPDITITLLADRDASFVGSLIDASAAQTIFTEAGNDIWRWQRPGSPIPPFLVPPLQGRFLLIHASSVIDSTGKALLLPAVHYQGKTSLVTELVRRGYSFLTDDVAVVDARLNLHPFPKPIGLRQKTLNLIPGLMNQLLQVPAQRYLSNVTGPIWVTRMPALYPGCLAHNGVPRVVAFIRDVPDVVPTVTPLRRGDALVELSSHFIASGLPIQLGLQRASSLLRIARPLRLVYGLETYLQKACTLLEEVLHDA